MKTFILGLLIFSAQQTFACINVNDAQICVGDKVYKGTIYPSGATVTRINSETNVVAVQTAFDKDPAELTFFENAADLDLTTVCLGEVCIGDKVYRGTIYKGGGEVVGINLATKKATVQLPNSSLVVLKTNDLHLTKGCLSGVCVGDTVYAGSVFQEGVTVVAVNSYYKTIVMHARFFNENKDYLLEQYPADVKVLNK